VKAEIMQQEETSVARQQHIKHTVKATNTHTTTEELLEVAFSTWSVLGLYICGMLNPVAQRDNHVKL
jgi:hypothetical protein